MTALPRRPPLRSFSSNGPAPSSSAVERMRAAILPSPSSHVKPLRRRQGICARRNVVRRDLARGKPSFIRRADRRDKATPRGIRGRSRKSNIREFWLTLAGWLTIKLAITRRRNSYSDPKFRAGILTREALKTASTKSMGRRPSFLRVVRS
jgi:hypothetical protein